MIRNAGLCDAIWQVSAFLLPVRAVGAMNDACAHNYVCAPSHGFLANWATRIVNEVKGINRVVYDVTSKPRGDD